LNKVETENPGVFVSGAGGLPDVFVDVGVLVVMTQSPFCRSKTC
jgi:hypothetical protein